MGDWAGVELQASAQNGCITRDQLFNAGFTAAALSYAIRSGRLVHLLPNAYRLRSCPESPMQLARAASLTIGPKLVFSHSTAQTLWKLHGGGYALTTPIHVTVPRTLRPRLTDDFRAHRTAAVPKTITRDGLPVTRLARTLTDLAGTMAEPKLEELLDATHLRFSKLEEWLHEELALDRQFAGRPALEHLLSVRDGQKVESVFESQIRRVLRETGAAAYRTQYNVNDHRGFITRADFAWPQQRVAVLCDSYLWHSSRQQFDLDATQRARLAALDWLCIPVTWAGRHDGIWPMQLAQALRRRLPQADLWNVPAANTNQPPPTRSAI